MRAERTALHRDREMIAAARPSGICSRQLILGDNLDASAIVASYGFSSVSGDEDIELIHRAHTNGGSVTGRSTLQDAADVYVKNVRGGGR